MHNYSSGIVLVFLELEGTDVWGAVSNGEGRMWSIEAVVCMQAAPQVQLFAIGRVVSWEISLGNLFQNVNLDDSSLNTVKISQGSVVTQTTLGGLTIYPEVWSVSARCW